MSDNEDNNMPAHYDDIDDPTADDDYYNSGSLKKSTHFSNSVFKNTGNLDQNKNETMNRLAAKYAMDNERHKLIRKDNLQRLRYKY